MVLKKNHLIICIISMNIVIVFMLINRQNTMIAKMHQLQRLQEQLKLLQNEKQRLIVKLLELNQLSKIEEYAAKNDMKPIPLKDLQLLSCSKDNNE